MRPTKDIFTQLIALLFIVILCSMIGQALSYLILIAGGIELDPNMMEPLDTLSKRQFTRSALIASHLTSFLMSSVVFLYVFHKDDYKKFLQIDRVPGTPFLYLSFFLLLTGYVPVMKLSEWNANIPLPEWAKMSSDAAMELLKGILTMESPIELVVSIFLVAIVPAIGEEVLYRGIVQKKLQSLFRNEHLGILVASLLFSLNHFQFDRFLPFAFLGIILGYAYHYSKSLWIPIILHFINNGLQVVMLYNVEGGVDNLETAQVPDIPNTILYISIFAFIGMFALIKWHSERTYGEGTTA